MVTAKYSNSFDSAGPRQHPLASRCPETRDTAHGCNNQPIQRGLVPVPTGSNKAPVSPRFSGNGESAQSCAGPLAGAVVRSAGRRKIDMENIEAMIYEATANRRRKNSETRSGYGFNGQ